MTCDALPVVSEILFSALLAPVAATATEEAPLDKRITDRLNAQDAEIKIIKEQNVFLKMMILGLTIGLGFLLIGVIILSLQVDALETTNAVLVASNENLKLELEGLQAQITELLEAIKKALADKAAAELAQQVAEDKSRISGQAVVGTIIIVAVGSLAMQY